MNSEVIIKIESALSIKSIADDFYQKCGSAGFVNTQDTLVSAYVENEMIGNVRLCFEQDHFLLRTMRVRNDFQRTGVGIKILKAFENLLSERSIFEVYCVPYAHLESFYGTIGFKDIVIEVAPGFLQDRIKKMKVDHPENNYILMRR